MKRSYILDLKISIFIIKMLEQIIIQNYDYEKDSHCADDGIAHN